MNDLDNAFLYDLNDLERVAMEGRASREAAAREAWKVIDAEVADYLKGHVETTAPAPVIAGRRRGGASGR